MTQWLAWQAWSGWLVYEVCLLNNIRAGNWFGAWNQCAFLLEKSVLVGRTASYPEWKLLQYNCKGSCETSVKRWHVILTPNLLVMCLFWRKAALMNLSKFLFLNCCRFSWANRCNLKKKEVRWIGLRYLSTAKQGDNALGSCPSSCVCSQQKQAIILKFQAKHGNYKSKEKSLELHFIKIDTRHLKILRG